VEDLLKKLPGVEVDKDGKIKANGQAVKRVLVAGKQFLPVIQSWLLKIFRLIW